MSYSAGGKTTIVAGRSDHVIKIHRSSRALWYLGAWTCHNSRPFCAGGHTWRVGYRSMGSWGENADSIVFFLDDDVVDEPVMAQASFSLLDQDKKPVSSYSLTTNRNDFSLSPVWFCIKRKDLEMSEYLMDEDGCFAVSVRVHVVEEAPPPSVKVPPSDFYHHLAPLLSSIEDADVAFHVGGEVFAAHRPVLAARSPVLMAQLFGYTEEGVAANAVIEVTDIEPRVFNALLTFMYTDAWPETGEEGSEDDDACAITQHLLVAADKYDLQKLKSMCEDRLREHIDTSSAATILALAEQHSCPGLEKACFQFLAASTDLLSVVQTEEFQYLAQSCPTTAKKLISISQGVILGLEEGTSEFSNDSKSRVDGKFHTLSWWTERVIINLPVCMWVYVVFKQLV